LCFVAARKQERIDLIEAVEELRAEVALLRSTRPAPPEPAVIRWLLQRAHPDRHDGSATAHAATTWLLSLRGLTVGTSA